MDIRQLRYFAAVADLENFTLASERLNLAQSALSRHIANLEFEVDDKLFVRRGRGVQLTAKGWDVRERIRPVLDAFDQMEADLCRPEANAIAGMVTVGVLGSIADILLPAISERAARDYPGLEISFVEGMAKDLEEGIARQHLDLAVIIAMGSTPSVERTKIGADGLCVIGAKQLLPPGDAILRIQDVFEKPLVLPPGGSREREAVEAMAHSCCMSLKKSRVSNAFAMEYTLMKSGAGILIISRLGGFALARQSELVVRQVSGVEVIWTVAHRNVATLNAAQCAVRDMLCVEMRRLLERSAAGS